MNASFATANHAKATQVSPQSLAIGIDIGGTKINAARISAYQLDALRHGNLNPLDDLNEEEVMSLPTPKNTEAFLEALTSMIRTLREGKEDAIQAVGVATAGIVDPNRGMILGSTGNLPAISAPFNLQGALEERTGCSIYIENDANAAAYGEYRSGAALGARNVLMVTLGTGVGGGIVLGGKMLHGSHFSAGEVGHIAINSHKVRQCTCGRWECWEAYASGTGLGKTFKEHVQAKFGTQEAIDVLQCAGVQSIDELTTHHLIRAYQEGFSLAKEVMSLWHHHIAVGLGSLMNVLNPEVVVIGGGMNPFVSIETLKEELEHRVMVPVETTRITKAMLGNYAGMVGAAYLALEAKK
ncbi:MAG: ROK family protein [Vampirovibrionales bacterium]